MTTGNDDPEWRVLILPDGSEGMAAVIAGNRWSIEAIWPGEMSWSIREIEADEAQPWTDGVLFLFNEGEKGRRRLVLALAPGRWRSCEPARTS
jgi:hypothetical protein